jgi:hypothetical protein
MPAGQPNVNQENNTHTKIEEITDDETPFMNVETFEHYFNDEGYTEDSFLLPYDSDNEECEETVNEDESYNEECEEEVNEESLESMEMNIQCKVGMMNHTMIRESKC